MVNRSQAGRVVAGTSGHEPAPSPGAGFAVSATNPESRFAVMFCGHVRVIACSVPDAVPLWCQRCGTHRHQAPRPLTRRQAYALAATRFMAAVERESALQDLLRVATREANEADAELAEITGGPQ